MASPGTLWDMFDVSVVYLQRAREGVTEVLLGEKRTGLGVGKIVGPGGKVESGETPLDAALREVYEEVGVEIQSADLLQIARIEYPFVDRPHYSQRSHAFVATSFVGTPAASPELLPSWWPLEELPLDQMWSDAKLWLPRALAGEYLDATFEISPTDQVHSSHMSWSTLSKNKGRASRLPIQLI